MKKLEIVLNPTFADISAFHSLHINECDTYLKTFWSYIF